MTFSLVSVPLLATQMTFMTYLQSTGQAVKAMIVTLSRQFLILLPAIFILNRFLRLDGLLLSAPVSDVLTTILSSFLVLPEIIKLHRQMEKGVYV
jgi:Na+-driven multidrug efflux pump